MQRGDGIRAKGQAFEAVATRIAALFSLPDDRVRRANLAAAPNDATLVDFGALAARMYPQDPRHHFMADDIEPILSAVPSDEPIAAYGVLPSWLAASLGARRNLIYQFDVRQGWLRTPRFTVCAPGDESFGENGWLDFTVRLRADGVHQLDI